MSPRQHYRKLLNSKQWTAAKTAAMRRDGGLCQDCKAAGYDRAATEVHHIVPVESIRSPQAMERMALDVGNLVCLCHGCHVARHRELRAGGLAAKERRREREDAAFDRLFERRGPTPGGVFLNPTPQNKNQTNPHRKNASKFL